MLPALTTGCPNYVSKNRPFMLQHDYVSLNRSKMLILVIRSATKFRITVFCL